MSDEVGETGSIGSRLRQAREAKGLQLEQAAEAMRLSPDVLEALEANHFDTLGAQVFVKGHLRQYAHLLGIDADAIIEGYERQDHPSDESLVGVLAEPIKLRDDGQLRLMVAAGVAAVLLLGLFFWWWASPGETEPVETNVTESNLPAEVNLPAATSEPVVQPPPLEEEQPTEGAQVDAIETEDIAPPAVEAPAVVAVSAPGPVTFTVEVTFAEDCWAEIFGGDDRRLFYGLGQAGARSRFTATAPMTVLLGNAGGVRISVNGEPYPIPVGARQGNLARFVVVDLP